MAETSAVGKFFFFVGAGKVASFRSAGVGWLRSCPSRGLGGGCERMEGFPVLRSFKIVARRYVQKYNVLKFVVSDGMGR